MRHAILIGINNYHQSLGKLRYCVRDTQRLAEVLTSLPDGIANEDLLLLTDEARGERYPSFGGIVSWLGSFLSRPKEDDTVFVYFAGHGRTLNGKCYLAPGDATLDTLHMTGIALDFVQDLLMRCKARQRILIVDACHSGAGRDVAPMEQAMLAQLAAGRGLYTIASCGADERSHEWDEKQQGVFSYYLAEALAGGCPADEAGHVTMDAVYDYVHERVAGWASRVRAVQTPTRFHSGAGKFVVLHRQPRPALSASGNRPDGRHAGAPVQTEDTAQPGPQFELAGRKVACPACGEVRYWEEAGNVVCPACSLTFKLGSDLLPARVKLACPSCGEGTYAEPGLSKCRRCGTDFTLGEDRRLAGVKVQCPHCEHKYYTEESGRVGCPKCSAPFTIRRKEGAPTFVPPRRDVSAWAEVLAAEPDGAVVKDAAIRSAIAKTGWPWRVRERATGSVMVLIPAGKFQMGSPTTEAERDYNETQHGCVIRRPFYLGETAVTQGHWTRGMKGDSSGLSAANRPVVNVSWEACQEFLRKAGSGLRLPSEAEWEYACRAGTATPFSFGGTITPEQVNYNGNDPYGGAPNGLYREKTVDVRGLPANPWGLYEMHGNVREWCEDVMKNYPTNRTEEPVRGDGPRVLRGGSWFSYARRCRSAYRSANVPTDRDDDVGFRLARTAK